MKINKKGAEIFFEVSFAANKRFSVGARFQKKANWLEGLEELIWYDYWRKSLWPICKLNGRSRWSSESMDTIHWIVWMDDPFSERHSVSPLRRSNGKLENHFGNHFGNHLRNRLDSHPVSPPDGQRSEAVLRSPFRINRSKWPALLFKLKWWSRVRA